MIEKASERQVGGDHYSSLAIQPTDYINKNNLNWHQGNVVKYITRCGKKGTLEDWLKDLDKVIHYAELEKERLEEPKVIKWVTGPTNLGVSQCLRDE